MCLLLAFPAAAEFNLSGSQCPHIQVLHRQDAGQVHEQYRGALESPQPAQVRDLVRAVNLLGPLSCLAVRRVAFINLAAEPEVIGWSMADSAQDLVYLNSASQALWDNLRLDGSPTARALAAQNFVHEASHVAVRLLQSRQRAEPADGEWSDVRVKGPRQRPDPSLWGDAAARQADSSIEALGLDRGVIRAWVDLHESWRSKGLAAAYYDDAWDHEATAEQDHAANGFASAYGGQAPIEDIAELAGWAATRPLFTAGARTAYKGAACEALRAQAGSIPDELAAIHAKLRFLLRLGVIDQAAFENCTGRAAREP